LPFDQRSHAPRMILAEMEKEIRSSVPLGLPESNKECEIKNLNYSRQMSWKVMIFTMLTKSS
jgi:hypothetical protein